jgi:subtilisin-like proprotein convertase family protein
MGGSDRGRARAAVALVAAGLAPAASAQSLGTIYTGGNGGASLWTVYFDLTVNAPLSIQSFDVNLGSPAGTACTLDISITAPGGSWSGNALNAGAWVRIASGTGSAAGPNLHTHVDTPDFVLNTGTYGVAIRYTGAAMSYTNGTGTNQVYSNASMTIACGASQVSTAGPFTGAVNSPRVWNGTIYYAPGSTSAVGACCFENASCLFISLADCGSQLGAFRGENVACASIACPPRGACCDTSSGACALSLNGSAGCPTGSAYQGDNTACIPTNTCGQGACCNDTTGACSLTAPTGCSAGATFQNPGTLCTPTNACGQGACCDDTTGACSLTAAAGCPAGGTFQGPGTACAPTNTCGQGACCNTATGGCSLSTRAGCPSGSSFQSAAAACTPTNPCPQPPPPANDTCAGAMPLSLPPDTPVPFGSGNMTATAEGIDIGPCNSVATDTASVWFRYDATGPGAVVLNETSAQNIATGVWEMDTAGAACPTAGPATICNAAETFAFAVRAGKTYFLLIQNDAAAQPTVAMAGTFTFVPAPANDTCSGAITLTLPPGALVPFSADNTGATAQGIDIGTCNTVATDTASVWFRYAATGPGFVQINETSTQNIATGVWEMDTAGATCPTAGPATFCNAAEAFAFAVQTGKTYYILMHTDAAAQPTVGLMGTFTYFPPPSNDACPSATTIGDPGPFAISTIGAAAPTDNSPIDCPTASAAMNNDVWYAWTATSNGTIAIAPRTYPTAFIGRYAIYDGGPSPGVCPTAGAGLIACNTFTTTVQTSTIPNASVIAGRVYYFQFAAQTAGATGTALVDFDFAPAGAGSCCVGPSCTVQTAGECAALGGAFVAGAFCTTSTGVATSYTGAGGPIPSGVTGVSEGIFQSSVVVPDTFPIDGIEVDVNFSHTFQNDLLISLSNGSRTFMLDNRGRRGAASEGATGSDFNGLYTFADSGAQSIFDFVVTGSPSPIPPGVYRPGGVLGLSRGLQRTFNGSPAGGVWTLRIADHVSADSGTVASWTLRLRQGAARVCPPPGVCCRGATCTATITSGAACASSITGGFAAGSAFPASATCNPGPLSNTPCCHADYNKVNGLTVQDVFDFLNDWFGGSPFARVGSDGSPGPLTVQNIFDFLNNWFAGGCV